MNEHNANSWIEPNTQDPDVTTNVTLQVTLTDEDRHLWDVMDQATYGTLALHFVHLSCRSLTILLILRYDAIAVMADKKAREVEYWHNDGTGNAGWRREKPPTAEVRVPGVVHESSTLYMGNKSDPSAAADENYRPYGCENVYVTGAALFPSAGKTEQHVMKASER